MNYKNKWGIHGYQSNKSQIFLTDYSNNVLAEAKNLNDLKLQLQMPKTIKNLKQAKLEPEEAKIIWLTQDDLFLLEGATNLVSDVLFLKDHSGEKILAVGDINYINQIMKKIIENKKEIHKKNESPS